MIHQSAACQSLAPYSASLASAGYATGVRPDLRVEVRRDVLLEKDGPMLLHGLQEMDGITLLRPHGVDAQADRSALDERYNTFRLAG